MSDETTGRPTLETIARHCGVTKTTVSRALRNDFRVSEATKEKIVQVAKELGYKPNPFVSAHMAHLRSGQRYRESATLALLACDLNYSTRFGGLEKVLAGVKERANALGYSLEHFWLGQEGMSVERLSDILYTRAIRGIIILPGSRENFSMDFRWDRFAAITFGYRLRNPDLQKVSNHHYHSMLLACNELRKRGYRRIGYYSIKGDDIKVDNLFLAAYRMFNSDLPADERVAEADTDEWSERKYLEWVDKEKPDAVITLHNPVLQWTRKAGIKVPEELCLAHLDLDEGGGEWGGVHQNKYMFGVAAVSLLSMSLMRNEYGLPRHPWVTLMESEWVEGRTLGRVGRL